MISVAVHMLVACLRSQEQLPLHGYIPAIKSSMSGAGKLGEATQHEMNVYTYITGTVPHAGITPRLP